MAHPVVEIGNPAPSIEVVEAYAIMMDAGRLEDAPHAQLEKVVMAPLVRPEEEIGSGRPDDAAQAFSGEGMPLPSMVATNVLIPDTIEGGDDGSASLAVVQQALPQHAMEPSSGQAAIAGDPSMSSSFEARVREGFPGPHEAQ